MEKLEASKNEVEAELSNAKIGGLSYQESPADLSTFPEFSKHDWNFLKDEADPISKRKAVQKFIY